MDPAKFLNPLLALIFYTGLAESKTDLETIWIFNILIGKGLIYKQQTIWIHDINFYKNYERNSEVTNYKMCAVYASTAVTCKTLSITSD